MSVIKRSSIYSIKTFVAHIYTILKKKTNFEQNFYLFQTFRMGDEEDRKLFVGGLPQEASQDDLQVKFYLVFLCMMDYQVFLLRNILGNLAT